MGGGARGPATSPHPFFSSPSLSRQSGQPKLYPTDICEGPNMCSHCDQSSANQPTKPRISARVSRRQALGAPLMAMAVFTLGAKTSSAQEAEKTPFGTTHASQSRRLPGLWHVSRALSGMDRKLSNMVTAMLIISMAPRTCSNICSI